MAHFPFLAGQIAFPGSLADPPGSSVLATSLGWLQATALGPVATTIGVIAVAWIGLTMLLGRASIRYGLTVILGCFILFGAPAIVAGLRGATDDDASFAYSPPPPPPPPEPPAPPPANPDPYAGAAMPAR